MIHPPARPSGPSADISSDGTESPDLADYLRGEAEGGTGTAAEGNHRHGLAALTLGALGVVYGDIGTSPLYSFREALRATGLRPGVAPGEAEVLGILSLLVWTLILIVTGKYVFALLRADNRGEGGILALYTLVRLAIGRRSLPVLALAMAGAALFAGDAAITPAITVLSAIEGTELVMPEMEGLVLPLTIGTLGGLFAFQRQGTARVAILFGPLMLAWFATLAGLGLWHLVQAPQVLRALAPQYGLDFLVDHGGVSFAILGAVFLAVTGGEALYADLGHFGRRPITLAWFGLVLPALVLNYMGQGALVLARPAAAGNSFFALAGPDLLPVLVALATVAAVIAAQAVITGTFSMVRGAVQLGFLPRMRIRHTAEGQHGQIYIGSANWILLGGVLSLVLSFRTSGALASAYGIAVSGTMVLTTVLGLLYLVHARGFAVAAASALVAPVLAIEGVFLAANLTKIADGGHVPLSIAAVAGLLMWSWWRGTQALAARTARLAVPLESFIRAMRHSSVHVVPGTAFFLGGDPRLVPSALLHNLKHNRVLHEQTVFLTVETLRVPYATDAERAEVTDLGGRFRRLTLRFGFMETPDIGRAMIHARRAGLRYDVMASTFFLGRRRAVATGHGLARLLDRLYVALTRFGAEPADFYHLPRDRVVELGERVAI